MSLFSYNQDFKVVNLNKVKYLTMVKVGDLFMEKGAIIFGGFIRDKYIHDHYANLFYDKKMDKDRYTEVDYDPDTKHRLLVPKDIDVFIKGTDEDIEEVYSFIREKGFNIEIKKRKVIYGAFDNVNQQKIIIRFQSEIGLPRPKIELDVLYSTADVKPPFGRLDLLCNGLLMDKNGIYFSNKTGSRIDYWGFFDRKILEIEVLNGLLKFETRKVELITETKEQSTKNEKMIANRIELMELRGWKIKGAI